MKITKLKGSDKRSNLCRLKLDGDMTIYTATEMMQGFMPFMEEYKRFEVDLSDVTEIDTAGVQLLLQFARKAKKTDKTVRMIAQSQAVREVLGVYHLTERFEELPASQH